MLRTMDLSHHLLSPHLQVQPLGWRSQRGVPHRGSVPGVCVAADGAVPLCLPVQREVPHRHPQPHLLLPIRQLHRQLPAGEDRAEVRVTSSEDWLQLEILYIDSNILWTIGHILMFWGSNHWLYISSWLTFEVNLRSLPQPTQKLIFTDIAISQVCMFWCLTKTAAALSVFNTT